MTWLERAQRALELIARGSDSWRVSVIAEQLEKEAAQGFTDLMFARAKRRAARLERRRRE